MGCWSFIAASCERYWSTVGNIVVDGSGMGLWNAVGWVEDLENRLQQSVGMQLVFLGQQAAGWLFTAVEHCSFCMWLG